MKTDDLIAALAQDPTTPPLRGGRVGASVLGVITLCVALFLAVIGLRPGLLTVLATPLLAAKTVVPLLLCCGALVLVLRLMRPEAADSLRLRGLVVPVFAVAALLYAIGAATRARPLWFADVTPIAVAECLGFILLISLPALALSFRLVRQGATTAPARSGALLGLAVSAGATAGYSLYCTQDNPIFFVTWYGVAILLTTALGALAGPRLLRW